ncbi:MAG TPA: FkbM family methyltransferase [Chthoniobacteraceae bacterium]|nr:FkbM family methyltransferase [Chthoniobacteraceae bacterium]
MIQTLVKAARTFTGPLVFPKRLPRDFGGEKIYVTTRSDIRLLAPGLQRSAGDLFWAVRNYVTPGSVVWDIGSNLGILTFCSAMKVGKEGEVYSLEADPRYADLQSRTLRGFSREAGKVSILCAAVANQPGILDLVIPKKGHARNHLVTVEGNSVGDADITKQVVTLTLDWLLKYWSPPAFIKIDVEGAEEMAVQGGVDLFSTVRPKGYIECSPRNADSLTRFFTDLDYAFYALGPNGEENPIDRFAFNTVVRPREHGRVDAGNGAIRAR